jgi:hypothetical protein
MANRGPKFNDGSLSDTQTYAEVSNSSYALWQAAGRLSEGDSVDNMNSIGSSIVPRNHKIIQHRDSPHTHSPRLNRSNSIR